MCFVVQFEVYFLYCHYRCFFLKVKTACALDNIFSLIRTKQAIAPETTTFQ